MKKIFNRFFIQLQITDPGQYRQHIVKSFYFFGVPLIVFFILVDTMRGKFDEALIDLLIFVVLLVSYPMVNNSQEKKWFFRLLLAINVGNFLYAAYARENLFWVFLLPLPAALFMGLFEGGIWILVIGGLTLGLLYLKSPDGLMPYGNSVDFLLSYSVMGTISLIAEYVRAGTQRLYEVEHKELLETNLKVSSQAVRDPLTGVYNRRYLAEFFPDLIRVAAKSNAELSIILFDIDDFKIINDTFGHVVGDKVLEMVTDILKQRLRQEMDDIVRYGGDEFLIVLRDTELETAKEIVERLSVHIEALEMQGAAHKISCSFGVVQLEESDIVNEEKEIIINLIRRADRKLYRAKAVKELRNFNLN